MKIGVVGNSHAAALRKALTLGEANYPHSFDFLVDAGGTAPRIEVKDGQLVRAEASKSLRAGEIPARLDPAACDAMIFTAAGVPAHKTMKRHHPLSRLLHAGFAPAPYNAHQSVSEDVFTLVLERYMPTLPNLQALRIIRSVYAGPLVIVTLPVPSKRIGEVEDGEASDLPAQYGPNVLKFVAWYYALQLRIIGEEARQLDAQLLTPPAQFLENGFTPQEFCLRDGWHMNWRYGCQTIERALTLLGGI